MVVKVVILIGLVGREAWLMEKMHSTLLKIQTVAKAVKARKARPSIT
jgi:hypothetical protein